MLPPTDSDHFTDDIVLIYIAGEAAESQTRLSKPRWQQLFRTSPICLSFMSVQ